MPLTTYTIHEGPGLEIVAEVDYDIIPASGDGYNEPREEACVDFMATNLIKRVRSYRPVLTETGRVSKFETVWTESDLGPAPAWVTAVIANDDCWQEDILAGEDDGPDPDSYRDDLINRELMER